MRASRLTAVLLAVALLVTASVAPAAASSTWPAGSHKVSLATERIAGADRFATAVAIARKSYPSWEGVDHVVVASGEDRAMADALTAASLCWAYDAPLLLVGASGVPAPVRSALGEIRSRNTTVTVTVVGGPVAVSARTIAQLKGIAGADNVSQPWTRGDRYTTAAGVAELASSIASETARTIPARAMVVNGTNAAGFVDALAASAVSAATGIPILLVERNRVPQPTKAALAAGAPGPVIVVGGAAVVSGAAYSTVGGTTRWAGANRYTTAARVASQARSQGWLTGNTVGLASARPDALTGSTYIGKSGGPLLHVMRTTVGRDTAAYLHQNRGTITHAKLFGGTTVLSANLAREVGGAPTPPRVIRPSPGTRVAKRANVAVATGVNTTEIQVYVTGALVARRTVPSYSTVDLGLLPTPPQGAGYDILAVNPDGGRSAVRARYPRHSYPAPTSIVVDKSDRRLYFFRNDVFVRSYPVAIGRPGSQTPVGIWRIGSKYHTSSGSVYGPRKMRMYRRVGSRYVYTAYNIHGTNQPSSIGTMASAGCIRLYNADILDLFPRVPIGTIVQTRE